MSLQLTSLVLAAGLAAFAAGTSASADPAPQTKRGNETLKKYCTGDYLTYCGNLAPEDPATDACFPKNWTTLTENCRRAIDAYEKANDAKAADAQKKG